MALRGAALYPQLPNCPEAMAPFPRLTSASQQSRAIDPSSDVPERCQQMVLCARPSSCHALPGTSPAFRDPSPRQEGTSARQQDGVPPREDGQVFPLKSSTARMSRYGLAMPVLGNAELLTVLTQRSSAGVHVPAKNPALKDTQADSTYRQVLKTSTTAY